MIKFIKKIPVIIYSWYLYLFNKNEYLAKKRYDICKDCKYKDVIAGEEFCSICWCVIKFKIRVKDEKCYKNKW